MNEAGRVPSFARLALPELQHFPLLGIQIDVELLVVMSDRLVQDLIAILLKQHSQDVGGRKGRNAFVAIELCGKPLLGFEKYMFFELSNSVLLGFLSFLMSKVIPVDVVVSFLRIIVCDAESLLSHVFINW